MKTTKDFGLVKVPGYKTRKRLLITAELEDGEFTVRGSVKHSGHTIMGGQVTDMVHGEARRLWETYHLNALKAGTPEQHAALDDMPPYTFSLEKSWYEAACEHLESKGLLVVEHEGKSYKFGQSWIKHEIPEDDLKRIKAIFF